MVYVIVLVDWICEAVDAISKNLRPDVRSFVLYEDEYITKAEKYFKAVRSFVVAHPLKTTRHEKFGFDGDMICVDVRKEPCEFLQSWKKDDRWYYLSFDGLRKIKKEENFDFVLYVYSKKLDGMKYFRYIGVKFIDLYTVASLQIEKLYKFDKQLRKLSRKELKKSK